MRLTLMRDGDKGNPLGEVNISDSPDSGEFSEALSEIEKQATEILEAEAEMKLERQKALASPAEAEPVAEPKSTKAAASKS